jgi:heme-degrading monooxygenase HmoA
MQTVVLINPFEVPPEAEDRFLPAWTAAAEYMRRQPGFVSSRLHKAISPDAPFGFINVAEWESPEAFRAATATDEFRQIAQGTPPSHPALFRVIASIDPVEERGEGAS